MKKLNLIAIATLLLNSCTTRHPQEPFTHVDLTQSPIIKAIPMQQSTVISKPILTSPKINTIDWQSSLSYMINNLVNAKDIEDGSILLVNTMQNNTNGSLQTIKVTSVLTNLIIKSSNRFSVISTAKFDAARQLLGLSIDDSLELRSKAIGLARKLHAQYVLYSTAGGNVNQPDIDMQLILVESGEIIWSIKGITQKQLQ